MTKFLQTFPLGNPSFVNTSVSTSHNAKSSIQNVTWINTWLLKEIQGCVLEYLVYTRGSKIYTLSITRQTVGNSLERVCIQSIKFHAQKRTFVMIFLQPYKHWFNELSRASEIRRMHRIRQWASRRSDTYVGGYWTSLPLNVSIYLGCSWCALIFPWNSHIFDVSFEVPSP